MTKQRLRLNDGAEIFVDDDNHVIHTRKGVLYTGDTEDAALHASVTFYDQYKAALTPRDAQAGLEAALEVLIHVTADVVQKAYFEKQGVNVKVEFSWGPARLHAPPLTPTPTQRVQ